MAPKLEEVFGVRSEPVLSYIERPHVDDKFSESMRSDRQIVVYGSSKQGKTSLVMKHLPYERNIVVRLTPKTELTDIYASILRQSDIQITEGGSENKKEGGEVSVGTKFKATLAFFAGGEASADGKIASETESKKEYKDIPFNLALPQDISELLKKAQSKKAIILENFHYLDNDKQTRFAFDLRTFQEMGIRFVILGVWREKNRLSEFNRDLIDRIAEVPVEPWEIADFARVAAKGQGELNIEFSPGVITACSSASFSSIGVFQELLKAVCQNQGILERQGVLRHLSNIAQVAIAIKAKAKEYASSHQRALESIASGNVSKASQGGVQPLFLPYYLVKVVLSEGYDGIANGMRRIVLQEKIQVIHHRREDVRASDMSNLLYNLAALQANKGISPPLIDYDRDTKLLQIVDSTFYFFLKNADLKEVLDELPNPLTADQVSG